jgi:hypothetical protein
MRHLEDIGECHCASVADAIEWLLLLPQARKLAGREPAGKESGP